MRNLTALLILLLVALLAMNGHGVADARKRKRKTKRPTQLPTPKPKFAATSVISNLAFPAAFTFASNGKLYFGLRFTGELRVYDPSTQTHSGIGVTIPDISGNGEDGLLGIALHPSHPQVPLIYVYCTRSLPGGEDANQILLVNETSKTFTQLFKSNHEPGTYHDGGRIKFHNGLLYVIVGDAHDAANAQNLNQNTGKILRLNPDGTAAPGNPNGKKYFAYGIRNSFGFDFDPTNGVLWETENGPSCNDELNRITLNANMGWGPSQDCPNTNRDGPLPRIAPKISFPSPPSLTGITFCQSCGLEGAEGNIVMGDWNNGNVYHVRLTQTREDVASYYVAYTHTSGITSMETAPDGTIYFSTGNGIFKLKNKPA